MAGGEFIKKVVGDAAKKTGQGAAKDAAGKLAGTADTSATASPPSTSVEPPAAGALSTSLVGDRRPTPAKPTEAGGPAKSSAKEQAKDIAASTAIDAAQGAVQGAMVGGLAGAAAGAAKGAAIGLAKDRRIQRIALMVVAIVAMLAIGVPIGGAVIATSLVSAITTGKDENSSAAVAESGVDNADAHTAAATAQELRLPWPLVLAVQQAKEHADLEALRAKLDELDPDHAHRDLTAGAEYQWSQRALAISDDEDRKAAADKVEEITTAALISVGLTDGEAARVYKQARSWALGEQQCGASGSTGGVGVVDGDSFTFDGLTYNAKQVAIMKTVIGIAKTMYPTHPEEAATVGLITTSVESAFKNYANDGVITDLDGSLSSSQRADYEKLKFSLTLDHDAVGSDHASVGIVQQQAIFGWGEIPGSTWASDYQGVITRIMTPSFAIARFFERMNRISGWDAKEPGSVAQDVQVSAFPDAYQKRVPLAQAIWAQYNTDVAPITVPEGISWDGAEDGGQSGDRDGSGKTVAACGESTGGYSLATGDTQALAKEILAATDRGEILWPGDHAETLDQVARYANGDPIPPDCTDDSRIFQTILIADQLFKKLSVTSLNRRCTSATPGAGTKSYHWKGKAVDFGYLGGMASTGGDPNSIRMILAYADVAPDGAGVGQLGCNGRGRITHLNEFADSCDHLHLDLGPSDTPFKTKGSK